MTSQEPFSKPVKITARDKQELTMKYSSQNDLYVFFQAGEYPASAQVF